MLSYKVTTPKKVQYSTTTQLWYGLWVWTKSPQRTPQFKDKKVELGVHGASHLYMDATWCHL